MKDKVVSGTLGTFQVDTAYEDWYIYTTWAIPVNSQLARWNDSFNILATLIHGVLRNLQIVKNPSVL